MSTIRPKLQNCPEGRVHISFIWVFAGFLAWQASSISEEGGQVLPPDTEYVTVSNEGHLQLDGQRVRYWGVIGSFPNHPKFEEADSDAQRKARVTQSQAETNTIVQRFEDLGFNFCRYWRGFREPTDYVKGDGSRADVIDYFFAKMKERGFKIWLAATNDVGDAMPDDVNIIDEPESAEAWRSAVAGVTQTKAWRLRNNVARAWDARLEALALSRMKNVATHFNKYTGLRWCDDPLIAVWELSNEEWWMRWMVGGQWQKLPKFFKNQLVERWNSFLKVKYGSDTALRAAWKGLLPG
ncbi:MAG: hypothetical protein O3B01_30550, partial [Planctomycetota bacterium]|nr:hypothetical protein [Planctomycetota bacterium]